MNIIRLSLLFYFTFFLSHFAYCQKLNTGKLHSQKISLNVKQFSEFVKRFNYEIDPWGNGREELSKMVSRKEYLYHLFYQKIFEDNTSLFSLADEFTSYIVRNETYIDFNRQNIVAVASSRVSYLDSEYTVDIFLRKEYARNGESQWFMFDAKLNALFDIIIDNQKTFIPPNDNELEFLQMKKMLNDGQNVSDFISPRSQIDDFTLFLTNINAKALKFHFVESLCYHINIDNTWNIHVENTGPMGINSGWLITFLERIR